MAVSAWFLTGPWAGMAILLCLLGFSLARAVCSIASKDLLGRTIPKTRRGRLSGYTVAVSGVLTVGAGALLESKLNDTSPAWMFALLLAGAASLWLLAAVLMWRVSEAASDSDPPDSALGKIYSRLRLIREDKQLRRFLIVRGLLISTALAAPYYVIIARQSGGGGIARCICDRQRSGLRVRQRLLGPVRR